MGQLIILQNMATPPTLPLPPPPPLWGSIGVGGYLGTLGEGLIH